MAVEAESGSPHSPAVDNLYLAKLEEVSDLLRWVDLSVRGGWMDEYDATEWRVRIVAWGRWLELDGGELQ
jgi:hypothetical protein